MKFRQRLLESLDILGLTLQRADYNSRRWLYFDSGGSIVPLDAVCQISKGEGVSRKSSRQHVYSIKCFGPASMAYPTAVAEFLTLNRRDECYRDLCNWITAPTANTLTLPVFNVYAYEDDIE